MTDRDDFYFAAEDLQERHPDRWGRSPNWRLVILIVVGISAFQILWLLALGWRP